MANQNQNRKSPLSELTAISPLDGRYWDRLSVLSSYFSEYSLMKYRVLVEIEYFIELCSIPLPQLSSVDKTTFDVMRSWYKDFSEADALKIKSIEKVTNHDVKAVEYWIKEKMEDFDGSKKSLSSLSGNSEFVHFALTSQDINNTAIPLALKDCITNVIKPQMLDLVHTLEGLATEWMNVPMLARTHGQPATPTRLGKECMVFVDRLKHQLQSLLADSSKGSYLFTAKFGGATGQFNAHKVAYPTVDWPAVADGFITRLGLTREQWTTQIAQYDSIATVCDNIKRINTILIDLCRDFWTYTSMDYFKQKVVEQEVGSSTMPHKVNPIDFENAEGNLGLANVLFDHLAAKLPISRLQRDLTDSTVLRNLGVPVAHTLLSVHSLKRGLGKLIVNRDALQQDLEDNWAVVSEAIQTILRRERYPNPYEALKKLTRGQKISQQSILAFIEGLDVDDNVKAELMAINPFNYTGVMPKSN